MSHHKLLRGGVALVAIVAAIGVAPAAYAASGGLTGTVKDALTGAPVSAAIVIEEPDGSHWQTTNTASDGTFAITDAQPGQYDVEVMANGYLTQWAYGHATQYDADPVAVPGSVQISLMPIQYGNVSGSVHTDKGRPVNGIGVELDDVQGNQAGWTSTDASGAYRFSHVQTGSYILAFHYPSGYTVWYDNATDRSLAKPISVKPNRTTVVNVKQPPFGTMSLAARDAETGKTLVGACFYYQGGPFNFNTGCSGPDGKAVISGIPVGTYTVGVSGPGDNVYLNNQIQQVVVTENTTTHRAVQLHEAATVHVSFVDATTGAPVDSVCVGLDDAASHNWEYPNRCGGAVQDLRGLWPDTFRVFAAPQDGTHGAQWVGPSGGTGDPGAAVKYTVTYGQTVNVTVRLDGAGSISGTVTDAATGTPVSGVCPTATGPSVTYYPAFDGMCTYSDGAYTLNNLGPYQWKVVYPQYSGTYAWAWSGNAAHRASAEPVQVVVGSTVTANGALPASGKITGTVTVPAGGNVQATGIWAVDAQTGDYAGIEPNVNTDGTFTISGLNTQHVWLYYSYGGNGKIYKYPTEIAMTAGTTVSGINITVPTS